MRSGHPSLTQTKPSSQCTSPSRLLMQPPNSETACLSFRNPGVLPAISFFSHPKSDLRKSYWLELQNSPHSACSTLPSDRLFFSAARKILLKQSLVPSLLCCIPCTAPTSLRVKAKALPAVQSLLQLLPLCPNLLPHCPPPPPLWLTWPALFFQHSKHALPQGLCLESSSFRPHMAHLSPPSGLRP